MTTKTKTDCKTKGLCHYDSATRTKFFNGMLLTDENLRAEQTYHREAIKRLNRYMWGSGIVCGLEVHKTSGLCITVQPGFALDCHGNAIESCKCISIDLADVCKKVYPDGCAQTRDTKLTKCLVIKYAEIPAEPEPVLTSEEDCGPPSDGQKCQASKYREGFCLEFRDECEDAPLCPEEQDGTDGLVATVWRLSRGRQGDRVDELEKKRPGCVKSPPCPACDCGCDCDDCAICLAKLTIDCDKNEVDVDPCTCRSLVWGPRLFRWLVCGLLARIDKVPREVTGLEKPLPAAHVVNRNPIQAAWDVGAIALGPREKREPSPDVQQHLEELTKRVAALERAGRAKKEQP
jgi:hypothetical protein